MPRSSLSVLLAPQQAPLLLARACEEWRGVFGDEIPEEGNTSPQATEQRIAIVERVRDLCRRHRFAGTVDAAKLREALGPQAAEIDYEARELPDNRLLPKTSNLRSATYSEEVGLVSLGRALAQAAGVSNENDGEEGGAA